MISTYGSARTFDLLPFVKNEALAMNPKILTDLILLLMIQFELCESFLKYNMEKCFVVTAKLYQESVKCKVSSFKSEKTITI